MMREACAMAAVEERPETAAIATMARKKKERNSLKRPDNLQTTLCDCTLPSFLFVIMASPSSYTQHALPDSPPSARCFGHNIGPHPQHATRPEVTWRAAEVW